MLVGQKDREDGEGNRGKEMSGVWGVGSGEWGCGGVGWLFVGKSESTWS